MNNIHEHFNKHGVFPWIDLPNGDRIKLVEDCPACNGKGKTFNSQQTCGLCNGMGGFLTVAGSTIVYLVEFFGSQ